MARNYKRIIAWQRAHDLTLSVYKATGNFPKYELYGLTSQLRRASTSVATNIVEGSARKSRKDYLRFLDISNASLHETEYLILLARDLGYIDSSHYEELIKQVKDTYAPLSGLVGAVRKETKGLTNLIALIAVPVSIAVATIFSMSI